MAVMIRKKFGYTVSVVNGSKRITACSKADWIPIKDGSFIIIDGDNEYYRLSHKKQFLYVKEARVDSANKLVIDGIAESGSISANDSLEFTANEYQITKVDVADGGTDYVVGDIISCAGPLSKLNSSDDTQEHARVEVKSITENGSIESIELISNGTYIAASEEGDIFNIKDGSGSGASLSSRYTLSANKPIEERSISGIERKDNKTIIYLSYPLPISMISGNVSVKKWEAVLDSPYLGVTKAGASYEIIKDFTPNLDLPLIKGELASTPLLYNESMVLIDKKIKELEEQIESLKGE
jgi:hypothetical protein